MQHNKLSQNSVASNAKLLSTYSHALWSTGWLVGRSWDSAVWLSFRLPVNCSTQVRHKSADVYILGTRLKGQQLRGACFFHGGHWSASATPNQGSSFKGLYSCHVYNIPLVKSSHLARHRDDRARKYIPPQGEEGEMWVNSDPLSQISFILFYFILFMAELGLRFCVRAFSSCGERRPLFIAVRGPLTIAASLVAEHRLQTHRLSNCGSRAQPLRGTRDPPRPGLKPVFPALAGRFSTTAPPGKPSQISFIRNRKNPKAFAS